MTLPKKRRRERVKKFLVDQLELGTKTIKRCFFEKTELTDKDIKRINIELKSLSI